MQIILKNFNTYIRLYALLIMISFFSSCVNDDSFLPEENTGNVISSTALVTVLNNFDSVANFPTENEQCFRFVYPITLGYNTDSTIRVESYDGLVDVISSQGANFNVTGLEFPINIIFKNTDVTISIINEIALLNVLSECEFDTIRDDFDQFFDGCFTFDYPVTLFNNAGEETEITTDDTFQTFYQEQGIAYQPSFKFPLNVLVSPNFESTEIETYFGFYRLIESCESRCPNLSFSFELTDQFNLGYQFTADFPDIEVVGTYDWFVDGQFIESDGPNNQGDNLLMRDFGSSGTYEVCIKAETPNCPEGIEFCKQIDVAEVCPELFFDFEQEQGTLAYTFTSSFSGIEELGYQWYIDDQLIEEDGGANGDNILSSNLSPGVREVCIRTETPSCPNGTEYCKEITVEPICPNLFFTLEQEGNTTSYNFTAEFGNIDTITYQWEIDGDVIEQDGGQSGDNIFFFQFDPGSYEICIRTTTDTCPDGTEFCEQLVIE